jgi:hypothetical protein
MTHKNYPLKQLKKDIEETEQNIIRSFTINNDTNKKDFPGCEEVVEIGIEVCGKPTLLSVGFTKYFPSTLPKFYDKKNQFLGIPHRLSNGFICFTRSESLILDERYPASILLICVNKVIELLELGVKGENKDDFMQEFEVYWSGKTLLDVYANIDTSNTKLRELNLWSKTNSKNFTIISSEKNSFIENAEKNLFHVKLAEFSRYRCIYIPLKSGLTIIPPIGKEVWDYSTFKNIIFNNLSKQNYKEFQRVINRPTKLKSRLEFIIIGLPLSNGNTALFGCCMEGHLINFKSHLTKNNNRRQAHPLIQKPKGSKIYNLNVIRWNPDYLLNRTGGIPLLSRKKVLIAGLGSVGSEIALRFAKAGIGTLLVVDFDNMEPENIHRHALGSDHVFIVDDGSGINNKSKVQGIKEEINRKYPFTNVETYFSSIESLLEINKIDINTIDLIVIAIGSPNKEMIINTKLHNLVKAPPTLYTWVEPLGIGGHTLVTLNNERAGCYNCLFKADEEEPIYNRSAFAKPYQEFSKSITGCGSVFTPYNFIDSERSAILTVDAGIKVLIGQLKGNPLISWKGDNYLFREKGFETTNRYSFSVEQLEESKYLYKDHCCKVCTDEGRDNN